MSSRIGRSVRTAFASLVVALLAATGIGVAGTIPVISPRGYVGGTVKVTVTGAFQSNADILINKQASIGDGQMTYLQFGVSGAEEPNLPLTVSSYEVGFSVARGKRIATAGVEDRTGDMVVAAKQINGQHSCKGVTSYDPSTGQMGKVDIEIQFTALS